MLHTIFLVDSKDYYSAGQFVWGVIAGVAIFMPFLHFRLAKVAGEPLDLNFKKDSWQVVHWLAGLVLDSQLFKIPGETFSYAYS